MTEQDPPHTAPTNPTAPHLAHIVARAANGVIGRDGDLPWRLSSDLRLFKQTTLGKPVLMGRKTFESLPKPLPGRPNLVLTRRADYFAPHGVEVFADMEAMLVRGRELAAELGVEEVMIIGGAQIYAATRARVHRVYLTQVDAEVEGDAIYPDLDRREWREVSRRRVPAGEKDDHAFTAHVLERT